MLGVSGVEFSQGTLWDSFQHLLGEDTHQLPADVQGFIYCAVLVGTLTEKGIEKIVKQIDILCWFTGLWF